MIVEGQDTSLCFDVKNMETKVGEFLPQGETVLSAVHAISKLRVMKFAYKNSLPVEQGVINCANEGEGVTLRISKEKHSMSDIFFAVTENYFIVADCLNERYFYDFQDKNTLDPEELAEPILYAEMGKVFRYEDIASCSVKNGLLGVVNVKITMKNQSVFKLQFPARAGVVKGMPNHRENRDKIVAKLREISTALSAKK